MTTSLDSQIGGDHYKKLTIQPMVYSELNKLTPLEHTAIKYITRNRLKGKGREDIEKAIHCCQMILDMYYKENELAKKMV